MSLVPDRVYPAQVSPVTDALEVHPERGNIYALSIDTPPKQLYLVRAEVEGKAVENIYLGEVPGARTVEPTIGNMKRALTTSLISGLAQSGYRLSDRSGMIIDTDTRYNSGHRSLQIHPAFRLRVMYFNGRYYLCLNHQLAVRSVLSLAQIGEASEGFVASPSQRVYYRSDDGWQEARFVGADGDGFLLAAITGDEVRLAPEDVIPRLSRGQVAELAPALGLNARNLEQRYSDAISMRGWFELQPAAIEFDIGFF